MIPVRLLKAAFHLLVCCVLASCAAWEAQREGNELASEATQLAAEGRIEDSLAKFQEAIQLDPSRAEYRIGYHTTRERAVAAWLATAERAKSTGRPADAERLYNRVLGVDPGNARARAGLDAFRRDRRDAQALRQAQLAFEKGDTDTALALIRDILTGNPRHRGASDLRRTIESKLVSAPAHPKLDAALRKPITIEFRDTPLRQVMEVFSRTSGINFVFDRDVRPDLRATVFLRNTSVRDAMAMVLLTNQLEYRVLDASSVVIYPNTPAKAREYKELTVRTFFLDNGDVKTAATTLRTILKTRDLIVDEKQNMIIMRDTPEAVRLAEKLIAMHDLPEPEVMLEVEILEVTRTRLLQLGVQWPGQMSLTPLSTTGGTQLTLDDLRNISSSTIGVLVGPAIVDLNKQDGDVNLLANPRIRTKNREKARILVGERVPNITTTATATGFVSESVTYVDVGLKLEVEPTVSMNDEIAIKIGLEVSNIVQQIQTRSGSLAYQIGTRNASTVLRLKEGENQVLAGLINDIDRNTGNKIPALGDIPILGRLFGSQRDEGVKTEIVLSITPRIVRNAARPTLAESEFHAGTETRLGNRGASISSKPSLPMFRPAAKPAIKPAAPSPGAAPGASPQSSAAPGPGAATATGADPTVGVPMGTVGGSVSGPGAIVTAGATSFAFRGPAQAAAGTSFDLVLSVTPDEPITSIPFSIAYDPKLIEITAVDEGDFIRQGGAASSFTTKIDTGVGRVFGTATRGSGDGASQTGALLTLSVRALTANTSATVQLVAVSPIGVGGRSVSIQNPAPFRLTITP